MNLDTNSDSESAARELLRSGRFVAMDGLVEWDVSEVQNDPATLWLRLRRRDKENEHPDERRYLKVGVATEAELLHVRRGGRFNIVLHTVKARDVLRAAAARRDGDGKVFIKIGREAG